MEQVLADFPTLVAVELARARAKHRPMHSPHEGYAVLLEELDDLWAEVKAQSPSHERLLAELVQIGAMTQRMAEDVLTEPRPTGRTLEADEALHAATCACLTRPTRQRLGVVGRGWCIGDDARCDCGLAAGPRKPERTA